VSREPDVIGRVVAADHHDPHSVLGAHPERGGVVVRAFRPGATALRVLLQEGGPVELEPVDPTGLYAGFLPDRGLPLAYRLEATFADGTTTAYADPYAFPPTLGELDLHLIGEGRHEALADVLGGHEREVDGTGGTAFAVWAPSARAVSVVGDFNGWDGRVHQMRSLGTSGVWELFIPGVQSGDRYKYEIRPPAGPPLLKADPLAAAAEVPPRTASVVFRSRFDWGDADWLERREAADPYTGPLSIYEVHLGSWRRNPLEGNRSLTYAELAEELSTYVRDLGFTHVELLPVMEHPFSGSWGYQVSGYYAPTARFGTPDGFRALVDRLHRDGVGVILDWVPAHFPRDEFALARFDGTALYEHADPRRGAHPDWGTLVFNYGRTEVRNFLIANALEWLRSFHADGLRVDAVASMLYLDYSRAPGEWLPNRYGGNEDLEAMAFMRELNEVVGSRVPAALMAAEESTAWPGVSRPTSAGGLGFGLKWNMGWMHDTLAYFSHDPVHRSFHHDRLTFGLLYAFSENFVLPLSHDEVVHQKGSLYAKMPGDRTRKLANLRALYAYMWAHPGKQLLFMGGELAQEQEWGEGRSLDWHLLADAGNAGVHRLVTDLNHRYRAEPALWERDFDPAGFRWLEASDRASNVVAFARFSAEGRRALVCVGNFSDVPRAGYRVGLPIGGGWRELLNTDAETYGGSGAGGGAVHAEERPWHEQPWSAEVSLPPLGVLWLVPEGA
jgi:1,4-alpha-glucan branching enzyme